MFYRRPVSTAGTSYNDNVGLLGRMHHVHDIESWMYAGFGRLCLLSSGIDSGQDWCGGSSRISFIVGGEPPFLLGVAHVETGELGCEKGLDVKRPRPWSAAGAKHGECIDEGDRCRAVERSKTKGGLKTVDSNLINVRKGRWHLVAAGLLVGGIAMPPQ